MSSTQGSADSTSQDDLVHAGERALGRLVALIAGLILTVVGVGLGVTMVLLPVGVPVAIIGILIVVAAIAGGRGRSGAR